MNPAKPFISAIIVAKNHARTLPLALLSVSDQLSHSGLDYEIIVVDAGSSDATGVVAGRFSHLISNLRQVHVKEGTGIGSATVAALAKARGIWRVIVPAENSVSIVEFQKVLPQLKSGGYDLALGSRALQRSVVSPQLQIHHNLIRVLHSAIVGLLATPGIRDTESGFLCVSEAAAIKLCPEIKETGAGWVVELVASARHHGFRVKEFPIFWENAKPFDYNRYKESLKGAFGVRLRALHGLYRHSAPRSSMK